MKILWRTSPPGEYIVVSRNGIRIPTSVSRHNHNGTDGIASMVTPETKNLSSDASEKVPKLIFN